MKSERRAKLLVMGIVMLELLGFKISHVWHQKVSPFRFKE
jgi:hypothetical protein